MNTKNIIQFSLFTDSNALKKVMKRSGIFRKVLFSIVLCSGLLLAADCKKIPQETILQKQFQSEVESIVKEYNFPGMTAAFVLSDGSVHTFAAGFSDVEEKIPMSENNRMLAASIGKTYVAAVILDLVRNKKLDLDQPVQSYLGEKNWFVRLANHKTMTLRHLLTHSSGVENHVESPGFIKAIRTKKGVIPELSPEELVSFVLDTPAKFLPGEGFQYSDTGYILAGLVVEKVTGDDLFDVIKSRILGPLELKQTSPSNRKNLAGLASGYLSAENIFQLPVKTTVKPGVMNWNPAIEWAGGGFVTTSRELALWGAALYGGKSLSGDYRDDLLRGIEVAPGIKYGIATVIQTNPDSIVYGHKGWIPGYCSSLQYYQKSKSAIAFQINTDVGIMGTDEDVIVAIEKRLANVLFK